tara:strand:- start:408 stop:641 length:234 start_codon:yes stop_codon:yes gene_type:complete
MEEGKVENITFDGKEYAVANLQPEHIALFNLLLRVTREIEDAAYNLQKLQGSQAHYAAVVRAKLEEDGIKPQETVDE